MVKTLFKLMAFALWLGIGNANAQGIAVIGHASVPKTTVDEAMVKRLYTGKAIEIGGVPVTVVGLSAGNALRTRFLAAYLEQDEEKYLAYWTVRRFIGKGVPPREMPSSNEVIDYVQTTPGAIGYINVSELKPGINVLHKK